MPLYEYECRNCGHNFETVHSMFQDPLLRCPECDKHELFRVISGGLHVSVKKGDDEITVGHLADRHRDSFSSDKKEMLTEKNGLNKGKIANKRPMSAGWTDKQKEHYIMTGEKPCT